MEKNENKPKWDVNTRSRRKIYEQYALKTRREICLNSRVEAAAKQAGKSKNAYMVEAIEAALDRDGYGRDM